MKKLFAIVCAAALIGAVSCKKEEDATPVVPTTPTDTTPAAYEDPVYEAGVFNPGRHIATVVAQGQNEQWLWNNTAPKQLTNIVDPTAGTTSTFSYKGSGLLASSSTVIDGNRYVLRFNYGNNSVLDNYTISQEGKSFATCNVSYAGGRITDLNYTDLDVEAIASIAGISLDDSEFQVSSASVTDRLTWTGENLTGENIDVDVDGRITLQGLDALAHDEIVNALGSSLASVAEAFLNLLVANMGDSTYATTISGTIPCTYTYDTNRNPYRGFWYQGLTGQPASLSKNNPTAIDLNGTIRATVTITLPARCPSFVPTTYAMFWTVLYGALNGKEITRDVPLQESTVYTYTYNDLGFPLTITDQDGSATTITYVEQ